jgi:ribonucleoside-diphosphate reductase alpha chain
MTMPLYEPTSFALQIFKDRYAIHQEESFAQACERVSRVIADAETGTKRDEYFQRFLDILVTNRFSPGGRIWRGAGRPRGQLLNCFCIPAEDSREGWGDVLRSVTIISGTGGGVGINFSKIRPRGTSIRGTGGEATGAVSLMRAVNAVCNELREGGGRRSALMFCLKYDHPDLIEFLEAKLDDKELNNANISVLIDNDFLKLLDEDGEIIFKWQGEKRGRIAIKRVWDKIIQNAWRNGDPGFLNIGLMNEQNTISYTKDGEISSTNPCFTKEMRLHTSRGILSLQELFESGCFNRVVTDNRCINTILDGVKIRNASSVKLTGYQQQIYRVITSHGSIIRCTKYHEFITPRGRRPLFALNPGDWINTQQKEGCWGNIGDYDDGLIIGSFVGDGTLSYGTTDLPSMCLDYWNEEDLCNHMLRLVNKKVAIYENNNDCRKYGPLSIIKCLKYAKLRISSARLTKYFEQKFQIHVETLKTKLPEAVWKGSRDMVRGYLAGIFQADGSVQLKDRGTKGSLCVRLSQSNEQLLREIQILLSNFGIMSSIHKRRNADYRNLPDGQGGLKPYWCKTQYELIINRPNAVVFENLIGFSGNKQKQLSDALDKRGRECQKKERFIVQIKSINQDGIENVYCLNEPETHSLIVNGLVVGNCGEIPLEDYGCCCLGAINLYTHVSNGEIDWDLLEETVSIGVRFLDNVLDQNNYPLPIIQETSQKHRRIGLGVMGLHDMLLELDLKYSSKEARDFVNKVMNCIKKQAYHSSIRIAIEKGSFHAFDVNQHTKTGFVKKCLTRNHHRLIKEHGLRNCAILCIAPTGTTSIVAGCSSGIEPLFQPVYERRFNKHKDMHDDEKRDKATEIIVHPLLKKFLEDRRSTKHFQGAHDISPEDHLAMQAVCQRHIDNSISKTVNCPVDYPVEELSEIIKKYISELKGITIYRDTSKGKSPLVPLPLSEAKKYLDQMKEEAAVDDCPSGVCDISKGGN